MFIHSAKPDVGFPSVCWEYVLLPLANKETALAYGSTEYSQVGILSIERRRKKVELGRDHVAAKGERCQNLTSMPQTHGDTQINRNGS